MSESHTQLPWSVNLYIASYKVDEIHAPDFKEERMRRLIDSGKDKFDAMSIGTSRNQVCIVPLDESNNSNGNFIVHACNNYYKYHAAMEEARRLIVECMPYSDRRYMILEMLNGALGIMHTKEAKQ